MRVNAHQSSKIGAFQTLVLLDDAGTARVLAHSRKA